MNTVEPDMSRNPRANAREKDGLFNITYATLGFGGAAANALRKTLGSVTITRGKDATILPPECVVQVPCAAGAAESGRHGERSSDEKDENVDKNHDVC